MELTITDRLLLLDSLPNEGDITKVRIIRDLRLSLGFTAEEHERFGIEKGLERISWKVKDGGPTDIEISEVALGVIRETLQKLNQGKKLTEDHISLFERFCEFEPNK